MITIIGQGNFGSLLSEIFQEYKIEHSIVDFHKNIGSIEDIKKAKYIIMSVPVQYLESTINKINIDLKEKIFIDTCSVKLMPQKIYKKLKLNVFLTHPMFGPNSYRDKGLEGQNIMIDSFNVPTTELVKIKAFLLQFNLKIVEISSDEHDQITANTLVLHHLIGRIIPPLKKEELDTLNYKKIKSIQDSVLSDSDELFLSLIEYNPYAKKLIKKIKENLEKY